MALRVATWNINSVRLRIDMVTRFLAEYQPDVLCLQETKSPDGAFPTAAFEEAGYPHLEIAGMKGYNGVAVVSKHPLSNGESFDRCGKSDCRHVAASLADGTEIHSIYIPAGGDEPDRKKNEKFDHKLNFVTELTEWFPAKRSTKNPIIAVGDFNIAPLETDVWSHKQLLNVVSHTPIEVEHLDKMQASFKWHDAVRGYLGEEDKIYSWWSYRARDWEASDRGRRLDHIWVTPPLADKVTNAEILKPIRGWEPKPSDHCPVMIDLDV
ncbi:MAG: exodeoxyribonuclease III [Alphaproteobacteria bacterium]|nr:exodeoxyribonuclease III [Alphaproteobacteria bacterium SS10]MBV6634250.1 exodeoxyribonuclease III [Alphaproteobacteria bacterium SS10]